MKLEPRQLPQDPFEGRYSAEYRVLESGEHRRVTPKIRGKKARRAEKKARQAARENLRQRQLALALRAAMEDDE